MSFYTEEVEFLARNFDVVDDVKNDYDTAYAVSGSSNISESDDEECFKRAIMVGPTDAEAFSHYADFLWRMKKDLWSAEEMYLQALSIEPNSTGHAFLLMLLSDNNNKIFHLNRDECIKRACDL
ncbi:hypothetical protein Peur_006241 [Populus x canadensis]